MTATDQVVYTPEVMKWIGAIDGWSDAMRAAGMRPLTIELRRYQVGALAAAHLRRSPWSVKTADLVGWLEGQDWSPATRKSYRAALRSFFGWARKAGHVKRNPAEDLPAVRVPRGEPRPTPEHVIEAALEEADDRTRLILLLAGYAGLRRAEIAGLRWANIDALDMRIDAVDMRIAGKGGHIRTVPVHPVLAKELAREQARRDGGRFGTGYRYTGHPHSPWVFPGRSAGSATPEGIGRAAARALGGHYTGHTLRHRFAGRAYTNTHDLRAVQQLLGHASPNTTAVYAKADRDTLRDAVATI